MRWGGVSARVLTLIISALQLLVGIDLIAQSVKNYRDGVDLGDSLYSVLPWAEYDPTTESNAAAISLLFNVVMFFMLAALQYLWVPKVTKTVDQLQDRWTERQNKRLVGAT